MGRSGDTNFIFTLPVVEADASPQAVAAIQLSAMASQLVSIERTRCVHPDGRAENDAEHGFMLAKVAPELARILYPELDENAVARYGTVHDDVEGYVGDTPTDILSALDPRAKEKREAAGVAQLLKDYAHLPSYCQAVREYEAQELPETRFVRAVDKLMVLLIHFPNDGVVLRQHYTYHSFLKGERELLARDGYKYGELQKIKELRQELAQILANRFLPAA
jgi:5'-deoxynucleotidase YfbR-like HD superfamily hydrolase